MSPEEYRETIDDLNNNIQDLVEQIVSLHDQRFNNEVSGWMYRDNNVG